MIFGLLGTTSVRYQLARNHKQSMSAPRSFRDLEYHVAPTETDVGMVLDVMGLEVPPGHNSRSAREDRLWATWPSLE